MNFIRYFLFALCVLSSNSMAWEKVHDEEGITVLAKEESTGILAFKAEGKINSSSAKIIKILRDHKTKHEWSPKLKKLVIHKELAKDDFLFSEYYKTPWPATDREFCLRGFIKKVPKGYVVDAFSTELNGLYDEDHIQADVKKLTIKLNEVDKNTTHMSFEFYGDMKGWMPRWLMNFVQKKWPLRFMQALRKRITEV